MTDLDLILAAENGDLDDDEIELAADAIYRTGLWRSVGWAGRFLRDVNEAFGWLPPKAPTGAERLRAAEERAIMTAGIDTPITASSPPRISPDDLARIDYMIAEARRERNESDGLVDYTNEVYG
jgi:hypothetical protein